MIKYLLIIISIGAAAAAQLCMKKSSCAGILSKQGLLWLAFAGASYFLSFVFYALLMKYFNLNRISPVMAIATTCTVVLAATVLFIEPLSVRMIMGLGLGILSIICLLW